MKLALIAGLALAASVMQEAEASSSAGGAAQQQGPTLDEAIADVTAKMLPGGEYHDRADYVVGGISGHYKANPEEVRTKLLAAVEAASAKAAAEAEQPKTAPDIADTSGDTPGQPAGAHLDAPAAKAPEGEVVASVEPEKTDDEYVNALAVGNPRVALVGKYADRVPVQLKSRAHLAMLKHEHGDANVEVLP